MSDLEGGQKRNVWLGGCEAMGVESPVTWSLL